MGLPQHWLQDEVVRGHGRGCAGSPARAASALAIHTHVNHANSVTPLVAKAARAMFDAGVRDVRNQGVHPQRRQRRPARAARPVLPAARRRADPALLLLHVRHDPGRGALAGLGRRRPAAAAPHHGLPARASRRRGSCATCRSSASAGCTRSRRTTRSGASPTGPRTTAPRSRRPTPRRCTAPTSTTTRSTRCLPRAGLVGPAGRRGGAGDARRLSRSASRSVVGQRVRDLVLGHPRPDDRDDRDDAGHDARDVEGRAQPEQLRRPELPAPSRPASG